MDSPYYESETLNNGNRLNINNNNDDSNNNALIIDTDSSSSSSSSSIHSNSKDGAEVIIIDKKITNEEEQEDEEVEIEKPKEIHLMSMISIIAIGFIANVEYGIVMPSIWKYIQSLGGTNNTLGWALSGFSLSQLIFLPLIGLWADKRTLRESIACSLMIGIAGNIIYAMSVSPLMIVGGRLIAGIGSTNMALTNSYIASVSTKEQRTKYMAKVNGINAIGLVAGPVFNLGLAELNYTVWIGDKIKLIFDPLRGPGWMLAVLLFLCLVSFIFFKEPKRVTDDVDTTSTTTTTTKEQDQNSKSYHININNNNNNQSNNNRNQLTKSFSNPDIFNSHNINNNNNRETTPLLLNINQQDTEKLYNYMSLPGSRNNSVKDYSGSQQQKYYLGSNPYGSGSFTKRNNSRHNSTRQYNGVQSSISHISSASVHFSFKYGDKKQKSQQQHSLTGVQQQQKKKEDSVWNNLLKLANRSLLTCFVINFVQNFVFGALETLITPITSEQYHFQTLANSVMYSVVSAEVIIFIFATVGASSMGIQDKYIVLFGQMFLGGGLILLMLFFGGPATDRVPLWKFALSVIITTVGIPTQNTSIYSLYSKLLNRIYGEDAQQGFQTGFMMLMGSGARILGPLWAGYGLEMPNRFPLFIVFICMWVFDIGVTLIFWKKLTFITKPGSKSSSMPVAH